MADLIKGKIAADIAGSGSLLHFATEMLKSQAGINMLVVPYMASGPAVNDLLGGQIQLLIDAPPVSMQYVKAGRVKALAVSGKARERFAGQGLDVASSTPEQFGAHIRAEIEKWGKVAKTANIKIE